MAATHRTNREISLSVERCEDRALMTLVIVLNGNALGPASPNTLTANAAAILDRDGLDAVQLGYPAMSTPADFRDLETSILHISHGQPIGIVGFSAGGALATRLAGDPRLHVIAVLDDYGPPDARDYFEYHGDDIYAQTVRSLSHVDGAMIGLLSGPLKTSAYIDAAFGLEDPNVVASVSIASFERDIPQGQVFTYEGGHGAPITASMPALDDFLNHL